ncbi:MAG TPA: GDP-mannose 4,6-dehydratase [Polyangia bacterium]
MGQTAVIVGAAGQDGRLVAELLSSKGYRVLGLARGAVSGDLGDVAGSSVDITNFEAVAAVVGRVAPDEIYHLAAVHHSAQESPSQDLAAFRSAYEVNFFSLLNFLEAIRLYAPKARLFYAASSHVFGATSADHLQNESTPFEPQSLYAMTKVDGLLACRQYRKVHGVFASVGILYNHESSYREEKFLTKKVIRAVAEIKAGRRDQLALGDLNAEVDWGYAPDYVEAMHAILSAPHADEFVVASGVRRTVRDFVAAAFAAADLDWKRYVAEKAQAIDRRPVSRIGDASKLTRATGWKPKTEFHDMVRRLLEAELTSGPR